MMTDAVKLTIVEARAHLADALNRVAYGGVLACG
jgi:hypothetical protein